MKNKESVARARPPTSSHPILSPSIKGSEQSSVQKLRG